MYFYLGIMALSIPWLLLFAGALRRVVRSNRRLRRLQLEGAAFLSLGAIAKWLVYDPYFGLVQRIEGTWTYWFARGDAAILWAGLLFFGLGYFLERRPGPNHVPWPQPGKSIAALAILVGVVGALFALIYAGVQWGEAPWSPARIWLTLGCLPFAVGYNRWGLKDQRDDLLDED